VGRGPRRGDGRGGVLAPGADATYAVWSAHAVDPATVLPDLAPGVPRPRCLRTVVAGRVAYDALR